MWAYILLHLAVAKADPSPPPDPTQWTGQRVVQVSLTAARGSLPDESLIPLLRVRQDELYNPQDARLDIITLHRVANFAQIEVVVEPWGMVEQPDGTQEPGVRVEYQVWAPPVLERVTFSGVRAFSERMVLSAIGKDKGAAIFPDELPRMEYAIALLYQRAGYARATAKLSTTEDENGRITLLIEVIEDEPDRLGEIRIRTEEGLSPLRIRWVLARHGLRPGRPYTAERLGKAKEELVQVLREHGYYGARVTLTIKPDRKKGDNLAVIIDAGAHYVLVRDGSRLPNAREFAATLDPGERPADYVFTEAAQRLSDARRAEGYQDAEFNITLEKEEDRVIMRMTGSQGPLYRYRHATFVGDPGWGAQYLNGALREAEPTVLGQGRVTQEALDQALVILQEFYRSQGYLDATLNAQPLVEERRRWRLFQGPVVWNKVVIGINRGPQVQFRSYVVEGAVEGTEAGKLFDDLVGEPYNPAAMEVRTRALVEAHREQGYLNADARLRTTIDGEHADVVIQVLPGEIVYLRSVLVSGYRRTRRTIIEREITLNPGDPVVPSELQNIRHHMYELDVFSRVSVEPIGDEDRVKDLLILLEERPNIFTEVGGGVATDLGLQVFGRGGHRNLFGLGHRFSLLGQAGVGWQNDRWYLDFNQLEWRAGARYEAPDVPRRGQRLVVDVLAQEQDQELNYRLERSGAAVGLALRIGENASAEVGYRAYRVRLLDLDPALLVQGDPWVDVLGAGADLDNYVFEGPSASRWQTGFGLSVVVDQRDDVFNPSEGTLTTLEVLVADGLIDPLQFVRGEGSVTWHVPVGQARLLFRTRGGVATVANGMTLPLEERFFLGGAANLRGFDLGSIGPANEGSARDVAFPSAIAPVIAYANRDEIRWVPTGGDAMVLGSVEFKIPFAWLGLKEWSDWQVAFFCDAGDVYFLRSGLTTDSSLRGDPALRYSAGTGIRRGTPIGPIQIDLGFNLDPIAYRGEVAADQTLFGQAENFVPVPVRLHLSLGAW